MSDRSGPASESCRSAPCVLERVLDGALHRQLGLAIADLEIDRIRLVRLAQHQRGTADEMQRQWLAFQRAIQRQPCLGLSAGLTRCRRHRTR